MNAEEAFALGVVADWMKKRLAPLAAKAEMYKAALHFSIEQIEELHATLNAHPTHDNFDARIRLSQWRGRLVDVLALPAPAPLPWKKATHRCKVCGTLWAYFPAGTTGVMAEAFWSLASDAARMGKCCDNAPMGDQIEALAEKAPPKDWLEGPSGMTCRCGEFIAGPVAMTRHRCPSKDALMGKRDPAREGTPESPPSDSERGTIVREGDASQGSGA